MTGKNPWTKLDSKIVYCNPWITVREDRVIRPDGKEGIYGVVETRIATGVVALTVEGDIYLVGQYRYPVEEYSWEIVEGGTDRGEAPLAAAKRELREEAGLVAGAWIPLGEEFHVSNCISSERGMIYLATELTEVGAKPDATEVLEVKRVPFSDAVAMVESGEIKDSVSIIGILRAKWLLERSYGRGR